jgi:hypothetical protein
VIERGLREAKSCEPSDDIIDFFGCYTLMACLEQLKAQLPEKVTRVFIMASYQLAKDLECHAGTEDAEVIAGVLKHLAQEAHSAPKASKPKLKLVKKTGKEVAA